MGTAFLMLIWKNFFDIKINGNNSTDNYNDNNNKKIVISMYQDSG